MTTPPDARDKAATTHNAAADRFDDPSNTFWERFGRRTIDRLHLRQGQRVLDVCCGGFNPWDRISEPVALRALLEQGGAEHIEVVAEAGRHEIPTPDAWWAAVLGSGYRGTVDQLDAAARDHVRAANLAYIAQAGLREVEANVVYALARKPVV